jgi:hypothetical protein
MKPSTMALYYTHGAGDRGVMHLCLEPRRVALQKRLFCEIFSRTGYFVLKFAIKVNFVKIARCMCAWQHLGWPGSLAAFIGEIIY